MKIIATNKKAYHNFFISDLLETGIVLNGSEVKSIRAGHISLNDSFVIVKNQELFLRDTYIKPYENTGSFVPDSRRERKLLLHKQEILKLTKKADEKGFTIIPIKIYFSKGKVKLEIGLGKGKKLFDKRETLKDKSIKMDIDRAKKNF